MAENTPKQEDDIASGKAAEPAPTGPTEDRSEAMLAADGTYDALNQPTDGSDGVQPLDIPAAHAVSDASPAPTTGDEGATPDPDAVGDIASGDGEVDGSNVTDEEAKGMLGNQDPASGGGSSSW